MLSHTHFCADTQKCVWAIIFAFGEMGLISFVRFRLRGGRLLSLRDESRKNVPNARKGNKVALENRSVRFALRGGRCPGAVPATLGLAIWNANCARTTLVQSIR